MTGFIEERLATLGIELPTPATAVANYVPAVRAGELLYISGQLPMVHGEPSFIGKLGRDQDVQSGYQAARICGLNILAQAKAALGGDLDRIKHVVRIGGFVNAMPEFGQEPQVINGCSDLMVEVFDEAGRHARAAVGVNSLPFRVCVEIEAIFQVI